MSRRVSTCLISGLLGVTLGAVAPLATAVPFVTDDVDAFFGTLGATASLQSIDFEATPTVGARTGGGVSGLDLPGLSLAADLPALKVLNRAYTGNHNTTPGGRQYLSVDTDSRRGTPVSFTFVQPIYALAFNLIDHDTGDVVLDIGSERYTFADVSNGESVFFGLILDQTGPGFDSMRMLAERDGQFALDDFFFARVPARVSPPLPAPLPAVPPISVASAPASALLFVVAGAWLGWRQKRFSER